MGLAATGVLTRALELRRGQVNAINLGGYAGALTGLGVVLIAQTTDDAKATGAIVGAGAVAGLAVSSVLVSRDVRAGSAAASLPPVHLAMVPTGTGKVVPGLGWSARW